MSAATIALNIAYVFYVGSGLIKTIVPLRIVLVISSLAYIGWGLLADVPSAVAWNLAFGSVHLFQLARLWRQHRTIDLSPEHRELHQRLFAELTVIDFFTLWSIGTSRSVGPGAVLIEAGQVQETVMLITDGDVSVEQDGVVVSTLTPDSLIGERSYLTGDRANATVRAGSAATVHEWNQEKMKAMVGLCPAAHDSMLRLMGRDLAGKLR